MALFVFFHFNMNYHIRLCLLSPLSCNPLPKECTKKKEKKKKERKFYLKAKRVRTAVAKVTPTVFQTELFWSSRDNVKEQVTIINSFSGA